MFTPTSNPYKFKYLETGITGEGIPCVYLPEEPRDSEVIFLEQQKWTRPEPSEKLKKAIREYTKAVQKDPNYLHPMQAMINEWADQEWDRCECGVWFWNNGVKTYITKFHYFVLTAWVMYFGHADYRETDKEICYLLEYCEEDPECFGMLLNTIRRYGKSSLMGAWAVYRAIKNRNHFVGMQGETDLKIEKFYSMMVKNPFKRLPYYHLPQYNTRSTLAKEIRFEAPVEIGKDALIGDIDDNEELGSVIEYRSSGAGAYDQAVLHSVLFEEPGKCHGKDTPIKMYDGSVKMVQDVKVGELLMGDDSTKRVVKSLASGVGNIYKIIPTNKKAQPWTVNEDHIISCKSSKPALFKKYQVGDVLNIPIKDYLNFSPCFKRHLSMYRVGVEYKEQHHDIHPYLLGAWLGDGSSNEPEITNVDHEIIDWLYKKYVVTKKKCKNRTPSFYIKSGMRAFFRNKNLLKNKHIPSDYMVDSRKNRLELLAGLIDTDGSRDMKKNRRGYEIIQKREDLAIQIKELASSLGFYASLRPKKTTMKRKDGTIYRCISYRVNIYGWNLYDIPCRVSRKKIPRDISTWNSKDPMRYGFKVEFDRVDNYYGFNISGNHLYLLGDYTVTHNTLECNINDRWTTVKPCLSRGKFIRGKAFMGTTVEFMDVSSKGGRAYKKLFYESDFNQKQKNNRTKSGLYAAFLPGDCAYEGFFDEWGHPMRDEARRSLLIDRESVKGDPKDLANLIRKYPLKIKEIFYVNADRCEFNAKILQDRKEELESLIEPLLTKGEFYWVDNKRFGQVKWRHNPHSGWCWAHSLITNPAESNLVQKTTIGELSSYAPLNDSKYIAGVDPIDHGVVIEGKGGEEEFVSTRRSRPVLFVKRKYDSSIDGPISQEILEKHAEEKYAYKTNRYILMMDVRPGDPNVFYERVLMILWYFGCSLHCESQKPGVMNYLHDNDCEDFILNKYIPEGGGRRNVYTEGTAANPMIIGEYTGALATYVEYFGHTIPFIDLIEDLLVFNPKKTTEYDYSVAAGFTELGVKIQPKKVVVPLVDINDFMPSFDEHGRVVS